MALLMLPSLSTLQLSDELKQHLTRTVSENYGQPGASGVTASVDRLQQDVSPVPWACRSQRDQLPAPDREGA